MVLNKQQLSAPGGKTPEKESVLKKLEHQFDWNLLHRYNGPTPFLLSGGINPYSVKALREFRHPYFAGIDINSRFETAPGIKDVERISNFLKELKGGTI